MVKQLFFFFFHAAEEEYADVIHEKSENANHSLAIARYQDSTHGSGVERRRKGEYCFS
jgi:hypothetical protein